jgi:hypothetical protein
MTFAEPLIATSNLPDIEGAFRSWLRTHPRLALLGTRVFFGIPEGVTDPFVTVARLGGGSYDPRLTCEAYGSSKNSAADVAQRIAAAVEGIENTVLAAGVLAQGGNVDTILWRPASPDDKPRYIVDITIFVSAT